MGPKESLWFTKKEADPVHQDKEILQLLVYVVFSNDERAGGEVKGVERVRASVTAWVQAVHRVYSWKRCGGVGPACARNCCRLGCGVDLTKGTKG